MRHDLGTAALQALQIASGIKNREDKMINIGTEIGGYKVTAAANGFALAVSETAPNPFVVWTVDRDGNGVCVGHYFNEREEAEWDFCARAFDWFEDNMNIHMIEDEAEEQNIDLHDCYKDIQAAREAVAKAAQMVEEMCDELDKLKAAQTISIKISDDMAWLLRYAINFGNRREGSD